MLYSLKEAAEAAGLGGRGHVLNRLISRGLVRAVKLAGVVKVPGAEVERLRRLVEEERDALTIEDVARDLRVGPSTARKMMRQEGGVPSRRRRIGRGSELIAPRAAYEEWRRGILSG